MKKIGIALIGILLVAAVSCAPQSGSVSGSEERRTAPRATAVPVSEWTLHSEVQANEDRYREERVGQRVLVSGMVEKISGGIVYLAQDGGIGVALDDLPESELLEMNAWSVIEAECTVGKPQQQPTILFLIMEDCVAAPTATPRPTRTPVPVEASEACFREHGNEVLRDAIEEVRVKLEDPTWGQGVAGIYPSEIVSYVEVLLAGLDSPFDGVAYKDGSIRVTFAFAGSDCDYRLEDVWYRPSGSGSTGVALYENGAWNNTALHVIVGR